MAELPICVLGIRSGSSLATRALVALGADPGTESELLPAVEGDNPKGYWEQQPLITLNDDLLAHLGGPWWDMPPLAPGWHREPELEPFRRRGREIVADLFPSGGLWVWKDPRAALTLPFWQDVIGPMRYVLAMRSPGEVASSLEARDAVLHPFLESSRVYFRYVHAGLVHTDGHDRMVVFYEDWFDGFDEQLDRLSRFATGTPASPAAGSDLREFFESGLRHHDERAGTREIDPESGAAYAALRGGADGAGRLSADAEQAVSAQWDALRNRLGDDHSELRARIRSVFRYAHAMQRELEAERRARAADADTQAETRRELTAELERTQGWLDDMRASLSWRLTAPLRRAKRIPR